MQAELGVAVALEAKGRRRARVAVDAQHAQAAAEWLAARGHVAWVQERRRAHLLNTWATKSLQATNSSWAAVHARGITGVGQTVGIADTGVDFDSCFFHDPEQSVAYCADGGDGSAPGCANAQHRKITSYRAWEETFEGNVPDYAGGHGTHVAGSVAGEVLPSEPNAEYAGKHNGAAPGAKIAFDDIGDLGGELWVPWDLAEDLFPHSYNRGARIHSNSWGSDDYGYDTMAFDCDEFSHDNDDFLILVAAGNAGGLRRDDGRHARHGQERDCGRRDVQHRRGDAPRRQGGHGQRLGVRGAAFALRACMAGRTIHRRACHHGSPGPLQRAVQRQLREQGRTDFAGHVRLLRQGVRGAAGGRRCGNRV